MIDNCPDISAANPHRFCVAPMIDWTDKHARYFMRLLSKHARLYTEMITTSAILHGGAERHLSYNNEEHPLALQIGGSNPEDIGKACAIADSFGYDEINLNVGCPSDRVQSGLFGACLMAEPQRVADCINAMRANSTKAITVKCRIGIDHQNSLEFLQAFIEPVMAAGCSTFIIHARCAWLKGLSPKENREIPPLDYSRVYTIKQYYPQLDIIINGGITTLAQCQEHLHHTDGVMIGREAYNNPYMLASVDKTLFGCTQKPPCRLAVIESMLPYIDRQLGQGARLNHITRHMLGLFNGLDGARAFRRHLSEQANKKNAGIEVLQQAVNLVRHDNENL